MVSATDVGQALAAYEPQDSGYLALKAKLAELRANASASKMPIANGPVVKVGAQDDRVPQLREQLGILGDANTVYDKALADAVKKFQKQRDLQPTGTLTLSTIKALNGHQPDRPVDIIMANMERWRWMPRDLGKTHVIVNIPDFTLRVMHDGKQEWMTKVVDGKPTTPTPIMSAEMKFITVNPTWNIPPSIVANEYLPLLRQDPTILGRMGLTSAAIPTALFTFRNRRARTMRSAGWLNFPNKFLVYQHNSNEKHLFTNAMRAASHGCMRVQDPVKYAEVLLGLVRPREGYTQDRIRRMFGNSEVDLRFFKLHCGPPSICRPRIFSSRRQAPIPAISPPTKPSSCSTTSTNFKCAISVKNIRRVPCYV